MNHAIKPSKLINNEAYYTFQEAVALLPFSGRTLQRIMADGKIRFLRCGKEPFFLPVWITEYIKKHTREPKMAPHLKMEA